MSENNGRCEFEHLDYCCPPEYLVKAGFKCSNELPTKEGDISGKCGASDSDLMTEEEWEKQSDKMYDKMINSFDDWEMKGFRRKWHTRIGLQ